MKTDCSIGIDQGSSSTKAVVVAADGTVLHRTVRHLPPPFRDGSRVEQNADDLLRSLRDAVSDAVRETHRAGFRPRCAGLSCQRSSCLAWSETSGRPLSAVLSWRDTREADALAKLQSSAKRIWGLTGLPLTPYYSASKLHWLKCSIPAEKTDNVILGVLSSFLTQRLTGSSRAVIDHTNAGRTQLMNINTLAWEPELFDLFGVRGIPLPEIVPAAYDFGMLDAEMGALPLLAVLGDQQAAMLGLGVAQENDGGINFGTGGFLMANTGTRLAPVPGLMASVHYSLERTTRYLLEGSVNAAGDGLAWLRERFGLFHRDDEIETLCRNAVGEVVVFLGLNGTGAPHWERNISSAIHGLTADSRPADLVRAVVENIAFFMTDIAQAMRHGGIDPRSYIVSGGLSAVPYLLEAQASLLDRTLVRCAETEASALGAAFLAGVRQGMWSFGDIGKMTTREEQIHPVRNPSLERRYLRWKELHRIAAELDRKT